MFTEEQITELKKPLDSSKIKNRKQGWGSVDYVESWHVIDEANRIFNFQWSRETVYNKEVSRVAIKIGDNKRDGWKVGYEAKVRVVAAGVVKEGTGHGSGSMTDLFDCIESAAKEAESDAMKRALMQFGYTFGLALYDKERKHVENPEEAKTPKAPKVISPEQKIHNWFIAKLATIKDVAQLKEFQESEKNKDARDKLFLDNPELSKKVEDAIEQKKLEVYNIKSPSEL